MARRPTSRGVGRRGQPLSGRVVNGFAPRCACGRISYSTELDARLAIVNQQQGSNIPVRCGDVWHTSKGKSQGGS